MSPITCSTLGRSISMSLRIPDLFEDLRTEHGCTDGFLPWKCITIASHRCCTCQQRSVFLGGWIESYAIWAVKTCWSYLLQKRSAVMIVWSYALTCNVIMIPFMRMWFDRFPLYAEWISATFVAKKLCIHYQGILAHLLLFDICLSN